MGCNCNQSAPCNPCGQQPCAEPQDCSCPTVLKSDCVIFSGNDLSCSGIVAGQTLTETVEQLDEFICEKVNDITNALTLKNIGTGSEVYKGVDLLGRKEIRKINAVGTLATVTQNTNDISVSINETNLNTFIEANQKTYSADNVGTGAEIFKDITVVGDNTQFNFKSLKLSAVGNGVSIIKDVDITTNTDEINFRLKKLKSAGGTVTITEETDEINFEVVATPLDINITAGANIVVTEPTPNNFVISSPLDINITAGANVTVTEPTPNNFVIASTDTIALLENSATTTVTGNGTSGNEYQVDVNNLQKVVNTFPYTLLNSDDKYTIFLENGVSNVVINVPDTLPSNFSVAFLQKGKGDVSIIPNGTSAINTTLGYKIKGQYNWVLLEKELSTVVHYLIGNTKL